MFVSSGMLPFFVRSRDEIRFGWNVKLGDLIDGPSLISWSGFGEGRRLHSLSVRKGLEGKGGGGRSPEGSFLRRRGSFFLRSCSR